MNLYLFWRGLSAEQRKSFCKTAGIGYRYMDNHLVHRTKKPSIKTVDAMVKASNDALTHEDVIGFFMQASSAKKSA
ncbi:MULTISPECIES: XRE family transcriptional regulator [unclassified Acinetobacter]|uniref:XRE family transcriptional regulator n=1 Tax=unclassified Acinetobacter TaxID=196816 RepID=UPI00211E33E8|nr:MULTISPECIES: XRE family transcriptional regulator [unclassified Acinetobacter]